MNITSSEYVHLLARQQRQQRRVGAVDVDAPESDLHALIVAECGRRGWIALHGSMAERTHRTAGEPDFVILGCDVAGPRMWLVECKRRTGKLSPAQAGMQAWAAKLGHTVHVVRSFHEFIDAIVS